MRRLQLECEPAIFEALRDRIARLPEREWERIRRAEYLRGFALDATHPPTAYRVALLDALPAVEPTIILSTDESRQLARETAALERAALHHLTTFYEEQRRTAQRS